MAASKISKKADGGDPKVLYIRLEEDMHAALKKLVAERRSSMTKYVLDLIRKDLARSTK